MILDLFQLIDVQIIIVLDQKHSRFAVKSIKKLAKVSLTVCPPQKCTGFVSVLVMVRPLMIVRRYIYT